MNVRRCFVVAALVVATCAQAQGPADYSKRWPVQADAEGAYAITLTPEVYAQLQRGDLADLAAYNADGQPLAFGPLPPALVRPEPRWREARWFALPAAKSDRGGDLHLHATRNAQGELTLDATVSGGVPSPQLPDLLIDVQPGNEAIDQLDLELSPGTGPVNAQLVVEASDDLQSWTTLLSSATVARLEQGGALLERRIVELPATSAPYLRLRPLDPTTSLPLAAVRVRLQPAAPAQRLPAEQWFVATPTGQQGRAFFYALPARLPVHRLDIALGADNAIDRFQVSSRDAPPTDRHDNWRHRGELVAFRLRGAGAALDNAPLDIATTRDREWRLQAGTDLGAAPTLRFGFRPETWLLLTHGKPPYVIVAGSTRARRAEFPLDALYGQVQARYGSGWEPPAATLGAMAESGGTHALAAVDPERNKRWLLWAVLLFGAVVIVFMVVRLLRDPPQAP
jgi:hypothetical protein